MTTIVYKNGILAADTQETVGGVQRRCNKLFRVKRKDDTFIIATAGNSYTGMMFVDWFRKGSMQEDVPDLTNLDADEEDFECLVWESKSAKLWSVNRLFHMIEVNLEDHPFYAIGSGADVAYGALAMGSSARRAVEIACEWEIHTGLPVETMKCPDNAPE